MKNPSVAFLASNEEPSDPTRIREIVMYFVKPTAQDPSFRWLRVLVLGCFAAGLLAFAGCTSDPTEPEIPAPEAEQALAAAMSAADLQQVADTEALLDEIENPLSSAAGNFEALGSVMGGNDDLGGYWDMNKQLAQSVSTFRDGLFSSASVARARQATVNVAVMGKDPICETVGNTTTCIEDLGEGVVRVSITEVFEGGLSPFTTIEQIFEIDTAGTEPSDDDLIRSYQSTVVFRNGTTIAMSIIPQAPAQYVEDDVRVEVEETVTFAAGLVERQTNRILLDVGEVATDGDEVIWELSSTVDYANGASSTVVVAETPPGLIEPNGITDDDRVTLTATFTAAPENRRLEAIEASVVVLIGMLEDEADDLFEQVLRTITFDGSTAAGGSPHATVSYIPTEPVLEGEEPCAGTFSRDAVFPADWAIQSLEQNVSHNCDNGGRATLWVSYADDTTFTRILTWNGDGTATIDATRRNGTTILGEFNDNDHTFAITTTFPEGFDPVVVEQSGSSNPEAGSRSYTVVATYQDQSQKSLSVTATRNEDGTRDLVGTTTNAEGTVNFAMHFDPAVATLTGTASGPEEQALEYTLVGQEDGNALLTFVYVDPAENLTVSAELVIHPDGSGCGMMTVTRGPASATFPVCFDADGSGWIDGEETQLIF